LIDAILLKIPNKQKTNSTINELNNACQRKQ
jgi:hypothetical protein